ncbi:MAG: hypothetical protein MJY82_01395 [Fibrobacter sp.]|nr:hypothetical protein [Fibrobacter sp.]
MLLFRTSFNLRSDLPWEKVYNECVYPWINGSENKKTGQKNYAILRRLPRTVDFKQTRKDKCEFAGESLEYEAFTYGGHDYLGFTFSVLNNFRRWRTRIALKRTNKHVVCFVSLDCEIEKGASFPPISKPKIIDYLAKFQDGDGNISVSNSPHFVSGLNVDEAISIFKGTKGNRLPIIYLSSSERTHAIKPSALASQLFGVAHVFAERDKYLNDRIKIDVKTPFPQKGEIGICYAGENVRIVNRRDNASWQENPRALVQDFLLGVLKKSLSTKFDFSWEDYLLVQRQFRDFELEQQYRVGIQHRESEHQLLLKRELELRSVEADVAQKSAISQMKLNQELQKQIEELRHELDSRNCELDKIKADLDSCQNERDTYEGFVIENDARIKAQDEEIAQLKEDLFNEQTANAVLKSSVDSLKNQEGRFIPLLLPNEDEMYQDEYICHLVSLLQRGAANTPKTSNSPRIRAKDILENILAANSESVKKYEAMKRNRAALEGVARKEALKSDGTKVMKPFGLDFVTKGNNHGKISFIKDSQERYLASEASTGSDVRGGKNEAADLVKAFLWTE